MMGAHAQAGSGRAELSGLPPPQRPKASSSSSAAAAARLHVRALLQDAILALELVQQLELQRWAVALAVVLVDMSVLSPFAEAQPEMWREFCGHLLEQPNLYFLHQLVGALAEEEEEEEGDADADVDGSAAGGEAAAAAPE